MTSASADAATRLLAQAGVCRIAHRGHSAIAPENTLPAFRAALDLGVDGIELDYRHTRDDVPVVVHDETLERTTNAVAQWGTSATAVASRTMHELAGLDAGAWKESRFAGTRVVSLADALAVIAPGAVPVIERKAGDAETLIDLLRAGEWLRRVVVVSFDWRFLQECRQLAPDLVIGGIGQGALQADDLARLVSMRSDFVVWKQQDLDAEAVAAVHERGLAAWAWTVNVERRARDLVDAGIDGLVSDDPRALQFLS